ncbi:MAG: septal ring lytic transglycosylase RlpA family protein [Candidatus Kapabacteria bacterium]|nr:septal ring lytic transglycosylase RlpA family protein [Ignavibacteriota bacterium]MCW5884206.1 septal ring lytic transglycosylase RlpA family protein [Candidatus Kapabacteria bacterium]
MIVFFDSRKLVMLLISSVAGLLLALFSINLLLAEETTESLSVKVITNTSNSNDIQNVLYENSVFDENIYEIDGVASHYGKRFHKRKTASGERYNMHQFTAAHKTLPFGTILKVTNTNNGKSTFVRINDRGPFIKKRIIDLSHKSADLIGDMGLPKIKIEGFIRNQFEIPVSLEEDYFYAYSLSHKPIILPADYFGIQYTFRDFNSAVEHYLHLIESGSVDEERIFIVFDNNTYSSYNPENEVYYIASWRPPLPRKVPEMVAEKVKLFEK